MKKPIIKKAQTGKSVKPTADSTDYFYKKSIKDINYGTKVMKDKGYFKDGKVNDETKKALDLGDKSLESLKRQAKKGKPGYDANGFPLKKKMQAGGVVKTQPKRVGPVDPDGAWTKVQERNLPPVNAKTKVSLAPDKELGATKMMKKGGEVEKAKGGKWIQKAIKKPGALRAQLGAKKGEPIPAGKLAAAAKKPGKLGQRARLAQTLKKMKK
jgi:hypothetical protein